MTVHISAAPQGAPPFDELRFAARARAVLLAAGVSGSELSVALVDDAAMTRINAAWRGQGRVTDVLAFSLVTGEHAEFRGGLLGDVVIAPRVAARQADELGHSLDDEMLRLLIHGVLHLLGHDHVREDEARVMRAREREILLAVSE